MYIFMKSTPATGTTYFFLYCPSRVTRLGDFSPFWAIIYFGKLSVHKYKCLGYYFHTKSNNQIRHIDLATFWAIFGLHRRFFYIKDIWSSCVLVPIKFF
jgi:hypothetical protein